MLRSLGWLGLLILFYNYCRILVRGIFQKVVSSLIINILLVLILMVP